jgi:hypothetical protein
LIPNVTPGANLAELSRIVQQLCDHVRTMDERLLDNTSGWAGNQTNVTADRAFDADATTTAELADALGTLISDLVNVGVIR